MPTYDYLCEKCEIEFEVIKSIKEYDGKDECPACGNVGRRIFSCQVHFVGTKIEDAEFNPGLGQITKSKRHRDELARKLGVEEIGNEKPDRVHKHFDDSRAAKSRKAWDEA